MYVIREGKKRGKGFYVVSSALFDGIMFFYGTRKQKKATRFDTYDKARRVANAIENERSGVYDNYKHRVVKLKNRP